MVQLGEFFSQAREQAISYPREMMLSEGAILALLGAGLVLFLVIALLRRSATSATAAGLIGMTAMLEAYAFARMDFLPAGGIYILQGLFITTVLLFLTACIHVARDNAILGALMLLGMVAAVGSGTAAYFGMISGEVPMNLALAGTAFFATILTLHQGFGKDRRAMYVAPGVMLASASILALIIGGNIGVTSWIGAITPHVMLSGGVLLASLMALLPGGEAAAARQQAASPAPGFARGEPAMAFTDDSQEDLPESLRTPADAEPLVATRPAEPAPSAEPRPAVKREPTVQPVAAPAKPATDPQPVQSESPISALWGKRPEQAKLMAAAGGGFAAAAAASGRPYWSWTADDNVEANDAALTQLGITSAQGLTPERLRGFVAHDDLVQYDEQVLGGGDPRPGRFDIRCNLLSGGCIQLSGERELDRDGFVSRITAYVEDPEEAARRKPADMEKLAAQREAGARRGDIARLQAALEQGEIRTYFQPIVRVRDEEVIGFEALARWHQDSGEVVSADRFIPLAVEAGIENEIIQIVAEEAAQELASWVEAQPGMGQFVAFNVTADGLLNDDLVRIVRDVITRYDLPAGSLVVELTESHVMADHKKALQVANDLKRAGARLALDDLGTGHSQINRLGKFPFDLIKTDKSLLASIPGNKQSEKLLSGIFEMARKMGAQVIVEGVENQQAAKLLKKIGCEFAQGFYFGEPELAASEEDEEEPIVANLR